jgi:hypothetical protein
MTQPKFSEPTPNGRYYRNPVNNRLVPSITNIKNLKAIQGLPGWAARECAEYAVGNWQKLAPLDDIEKTALIKGAPWRSDPAQPSASLIGDIVHGWIDAYVKGENVNINVFTDAKGNEHPSPTQARQMWRQFGGWVQKYRPRFLASEFTVWSHAHEYAGTADLGAYIGQGANAPLVLIDHKTGGNVYPDTAIQLAALGNADVILQDDGTEAPLPHFDRFAILHIRPRFTRFVPVQHTDEWFRAFLGLKAVFDAVVSVEETTLLVAPKTEVRALCQQR